MKRNHTVGESLTLAERRALSWAVKRAAQNSTLLFYWPGFDGRKDEKAYEARVKLARSAMRKVAELWRQGL